MKMSDLTGIPNAPNQCLYNDPSVYVKTEYDQDSPNPSSSMSSGGAVAMSPSDVPANAALLHGGLSTGLHVGGSGGPLNALLWAKSQHLPLEITRQLQGIYGDHFPVEARHALAGWIETTAFNEELDTSNPQYEEHARIMVQTMVQQLQIKAAECLDYHHKQKLEHIVEHFKTRYAHNPLDLYHIVQHCLRQEMDIIQKADLMNQDCSSPPGVSQSTSEAAYRIQQQLVALKKSTDECSAETNKTAHIQETHSLNYYKHHQMTVQLESGQHNEASHEYSKFQEWKDRFAEDLRQSFNTLKVKISTLMNSHLEMTKQLKDLQYRILELELSKWKRDQQLSGNGAPFANNIDQIQNWCEECAEIIWLNRSHVRRLEIIQESLNMPSHEVPMVLLPELSEGYTQLLDTLVKSSFVIEKQPPQVLKTNTRFSATVRLLVGTKLKVHINPPTVSVSIISEAQANSLLRMGPNPKSRSQFSSGEILNNKQTMEYHQATGQLSVSFRNMSLRKIKRAEKKGTESVMDEKFSLLFWSEFTIGNNEFSCNYQVLAPSLPVVVIVHGNQEPHAWATILWDNAFAEWGRQPFLVPDKVPWGQLANTLNMKFKASCGRGLSEDNLRFLASKAFRSQGYHHDFSNAMMSWSQFCKEPLPDRSFTFWDWFHAVMKLTKEDLRGLWIDGALLGFISRQEAEEYLHKSENGTFIIRFSDSELGGVTVAWITVDDKTGQREVAMLMPYTRKDLLIRSLPDRISDSVQMLYLYPNIPKDVAFGKYYNNQHESMPQRNPRNGYVPHHLVNVIQGPFFNNPITDSVPPPSTPRTPLPSHQHSISSNFCETPQSPLSSSSTAMVSNSTNRSHPVPGGIPGKSRNPVLQPQHSSSSTDSGTAIKLEDGPFG
ncbi:signal transducer and activator of transcription 5B-like isoform X2 [Tigriopus californicus]|nr:signal transducer and activator of transcription 5B-like isoform X2 [Tigriopus californicus]